MKLLDNEVFLPTATTLIDCAEKFIYISSFKLEISSTPRGRGLAYLFELLGEQWKKGIDIRVLTNKQGEQGHVPSTNSFAINVLKRHHIPVKVLPDSRICHAKIILVDNKAAIIGSHNLSIKSCRQNFEQSCLIDSPCTCMHLHQNFLKLWETGRDA